MLGLPESKSSPKNPVCIEQAVRLMCWNDGYKDWITRNKLQKKSDNQSYKNYV